MRIKEIVTIAVFSFFSSTSFASGTVFFGGRQLVQFNDSGVVYNEFGDRIGSVEPNGGDYSVYSNNGLSGFLRTDGLVFRYRDTAWMGEVDAAGRVTNVHGQMVGELRESPISNLGRAAAATILLRSE